MRQNSTRGLFFSRAPHALLLRPRIRFALYDAHFMLTRLQRLRNARIAFALTSSGSYAGSQTGRFFSVDKKRLRDARTYFRISRQNLTFREVFVGLPSGRKLLCVRSACCCPKTRPACALRKSRFTIWSWRRDLNPRPSDYKSDALPAELRQHKPPVTGHKVNKLAQRQSACNTSALLPC